MRFVYQCLAVVIVLTGIGVGPVWAHKVNLFAYTEGGIVYTESYFSDGVKVKGGRIEVQDAGGTTLLKGITDDQGLFSFPLSQKEDMTIILNAGMGHKGTYLLKKEEM
ncbi:carboxypeptidase regulatory-like domain-containing protein [Desulfobulbus oligotrophicus]|jgi:nickel transport protein|uniref:Carboxypeptidase regulatory-like domain-containing protein n=1 Tax=Desulfobulbus oligotrophicus TaxID=1909699 RepID=A0A7T5VBX3_9BACT|nr:carboxypeptidase regulatory-like domain-containing protein [Desulfobulbus oligotrophicus]MDY0390761.1 hypothetical protein [Desulfobulbus oligotrophicus]QQG65044.1 carboxypeptidase regulatory-like domain-containing protein [Desulfobulbus oligotrophicus]